MFGLTMKKIPACDCESHEGEIVDLRDKLLAMERKEGESYRCKDYIFRRCLEDLQLNTQLSDSINPTQPASLQETEIDSACRQTMCEWSYRIVDHFDGRRELVEISMNYLDRFLDKMNCDRTAYKLASITSIYISIKLFNPKAISMKALAELSRGEFQEGHIAEMERIMLQSLSWNLSPPTTACFIGFLHTLLPSTVKQSARQTILQRSNFFSELAVLEYDFVTFMPSDRAFAAILNVLDGIDASHMSEEDKSVFIQEIENAFEDKLALSKNISTIREKLWNLYRQSEQFKYHDLELLMDRSKESSNGRPGDKTGKGDQSPVSVTKV